MVPEVQGTYITGTRYSVLKKKERTEGFGLGVNSGGCLVDGDHGEKYGGT